MRKKTRRLAMKSGLLFVVLPLCLAVNVQAASFDCDKASTKVEKMICSSAELAKLDDELNRVYEEALKKTTDPAGFKEQQRKWLKERNQCIDTSCLREKYQQRLVSVNQTSPFYTAIYPDDISEFKVDCSKADSIAEKILCGQLGSVSEKEWLTTAHYRMLSDFQWALMRVKDKQQLLESQRQWLKSIRNSCTSYSCEDSFRERSMELIAIAERPGVCYTLRPLEDGSGHISVDALGNLPVIEPVCQAMEENLNQFCDQPPMVCELKVSPRFQGQITFPEWVPLDPKVNLALIEEFIRAPWEEGLDKKTPKEIWEAERLKVEAALAANRLTFSKAQLDLYNLGKLQPAYRLDYGTCKIYNPGPTQRWIDPAGSMGIEIQQAPEVIRPLFQKYLSNDNGTASETFLYGGQTYTYWMVGGVKTRQMFYVNRHEKFIIPGASKVGLHMKNICGFEYQAIKEDKNEF